jgi:hypothetical protein
MPLAQNDDQPLTSRYSGREQSARSKHKSPPAADLERYAIHRAT